MSISIDFRISLVASPLRAPWISKRSATLLYETSPNARVRAREMYGWKGARTERGILQLERYVMAQSTLDFFKGKDRPRLESELGDKNAERQAWERQMGAVCKCSPLPHYPKSGLDVKKVTSDV